MNSDSTRPADDGWDRGWEDHKQKQRLRLAALDFWEKLRWLEEAHDLVEFLGRAKRPTDDRDVADDETRKNSP